MHHVNYSPEVNSLPRYHAIRHYIIEERVEVNYIPTGNQPADILTKPLRPTKHQQCLELLNMMNMESVEDQIIED